MKKNLIIVAAVLFTTLSAFGQQGNGSCAALVAGSPQQDGGAYATSFSATSILDIDLTLVFTPGSINRFGAGDHVAEFRLYTPKGNLYQSIAVPFTSDRGKEGQPQAIEGYPRPMAAKLLKKTEVKGQPGFGVTAILPVAGTSIVTSSLYGDWRAEAYIDGELAPCSSVATFAIGE